MAFYDEMATVADELITEFGQVVTITRKGKVDYNPTTGATEHSDIVFNGVAVVEPYADYRADSLIKAGDMKITLASKGLPHVLRVDDTVTIGGDIYHIVNIKETNPAGKSLIYEIQGRR